jgi:hypothetical protein
LDVALTGLGKHWAAVGAFAFRLERRRSASSFKVCLFWVFWTGVPVASAKMEIAAGLKLEVFRQKDNNMLWRLMSSSSMLSLCWLMISGGGWGKVLSNHHCQPDDLGEKL